MGKTGPKLSPEEHEAEIRKRNDEHHLRFEALKQKRPISFKEAMDFAMQAPLLSKESKQGAEQRNRPNNLLRSARANRVTKFGYLCDAPSNYWGQNSAEQEQWTRENFIGNLDEPAITEMMLDASNTKSNSRVESFETLEFICIKWLQRERICSPVVHNNDPDILNRLNDVDSLQKFEPQDIGLELRNWLADYLLGRIKRPSKKGQKKDTNHSRNIKIIRVLSEIERLGIPPTRGKNNSPTSGIDAVDAAVSTNWGINLGYKAFETIWNSRSESRPE